MSAALSINPVTAALSGRPAVPLRLVQDRQTVRPRPVCALPALHFAPDNEIFAQGEPVRSLYKLVSGVVRACKYAADGRRHIDAFYYPGEVFGFALEAEHTMCAEAVSDCVVTPLRRIEVEGDAPSMYVHAMRHQVRAQAHGQWLGRCSAPQKLANFLCELAALQHGAVLDLPMTRQDIADYLGLTIETISRTLAQLEREGVIALPSARRVGLLNPAALTALCG